MSFISELRRRNVLRVGAAYIVTAWLVVQVVETLFPMYGLSDAAARTVVNILAIGLVPVLVLAWVFEWTPEGLKRDSEVTLAPASSIAAAKRLDRIILAVLALALGYFAFDKFVLDPARDAQMADAAREEGRSEAVIDAFGDASIAVLAFADMSPGKDQEYLSDGIAEEILHLLEKVDGLRVISRTSAFSFKGKDTPIPEIARQLNVAHVLEGSVRKAGDRIRVTAQLIEARTDRHIWSQTYDRTLDDIFAIQDELASAMVEQLHVQLLGSAPTRQRIDPDAYLLYLEGRHFASYSDNPGRAMELLERVVQIEPDYVDAWLVLSTTYLNLSPTARMQDHTGDTYWQKSIDAANRALEIDPDHPAILAGKAWDAMVLEGDLHKTARLLERAMPRALSNPDATEYVAFMLNWFGRDDLAMQMLEFLLQKDPLCAACNYRYARAAKYAGRYEDAERAINRFRALQPGSTGFITQAVSRLMLGNIAVAREAIEQHRLSDPADSHGQIRYVELLMRLKTGDADGISVDIESLAADPEVRLEPTYFAELYALNGQPDKAFGYLRNLVDDYQKYVAISGLQSPFLEPLHDDSRWLPLQEELGVAPWQLEEIGFNPGLPLGLLGSE